jgi:glycosyltransferase involved in cell wall biosynthesis
MGKTHRHYTSFQDGARNNQVHSNDRKTQIPHVTVTIPVFNRARLVGRTIESVLSQTFKDFDLLIVDDCSTDGTVEVIREYLQRDRRIRLIVNKRNLGLTRNWNKCIDNAEGPLIQILLSDDLIDEEYLCIASQVFQNNPTLGFLAASCRYIDYDDNIMHAGIARTPTLYRAGDQAVSALLTDGFPHVSSIVMRRSCVEKVGKFDERIWHGPDVEMDCRIASTFDFFHLGRVYTSFRRHFTNMGFIEYLREDFLEVDMLKKRRAWSYLSEDGQRALGIADLEKHLLRDCAKAAMTGSMVCMAYGNSRLSRHYLRKAVRLDQSSTLSGTLWKGVALNIVPCLGRKVMRNRMRFEQGDMSRVRLASSSLNSLGST